MPRKKDYRKVSSNHSAMALERRVAVRDLAASLAAQGDTAADGLVKELECVLREGEEMPDVRFVLELLERRVQLAGEELDRADEERWLEEMRTSVARHESHQAQEELYAETVRVRKSLVECFGSKRCRLQFGLSERTPRGMTDLAFEARRIVDRLSRPQLKLPELRLPGLKPDPEGWVKRLRPSLVRLEALLQEIAGRQVKVVDRIADCRQAMAACDATYLHVARTAEALFVLGGCPELARRLRPTQHRERSRQTAGSPAPVAQVRKIAAGITAAAARCRDWLRSVLRRPVSVVSVPWKLPSKPDSRKPGVPALSGRIPQAEIV